MAEACLRHQVRRLVYCSTQGVHGHVARPPGDESSPIAPEDYYQQTKYEGEQALWEVARGGLEASVVRPMGIYGPGDPGRFLMLYRAVRRGRFLMFGDGETFYHPCYIDNLVDAFELAAEHPKAVGETYLIGDDRYVSLNELVRTVAQSLGQPVKIVHLPFTPLWAASVLCEAVLMPLGIEPPCSVGGPTGSGRRGRSPSTRRSGSSASSLAVPLAEGLRRTGAWYREKGYLG